jgi:hypothetical protein
VISTMDSNSCLNLTGAPRGGGTSAQAIKTRMKWVSTGIPFRRVADLTGTHPETARRYLRGLADPPPAFVAAFCQGLGVNSAWLLLGDGEPHVDHGAAAASLRSHKQSLVMLVDQMQRQIAALP